MKNLIIVSTILMIFSSCIVQDKQLKIFIKEYYFPYSEFTTEKTYCFQNVNDTTDKAYWVMKTEISGNDTILITKILDATGNNVEYLVEKIDNKGTKMIEHILYYEEIIDTCRIIDNNIFNWEMYVGENITWKVDFQETGTSRIIEFSKNRNLIHYDSISNTIKFNDKMKYKVVGSNYTSDWEVEFEYTKNIGATHYKVFIDNEDPKEYKLIKNSP